MIKPQSVQRLDHLTFKGNHQHTRYGWLRLTPAYSIHLVAELLDQQPGGGSTVLDPFCGTGTTALVCAERGLACDTIDINPFLVWLARVKTRTYMSSCVDALQEVAGKIARGAMIARNGRSWIPPLHQIEKWWDTPTLTTLGRLMAEIIHVSKSVPIETIDLLKLAFCRTIIKQANVSFGHQSMSFKKIPNAPLLPGLDTAEGAVVDTWMASVSLIASSARSQIAKEPRVLLSDARAISRTIPVDHYSCVITSPPYPNRMSYIRELRPYMYWLGYLKDGRAAGELDWQAIGGTWGCATSNVSKWQPAVPRGIPYEGFQAILEGIEQHSPLLSRYVHKYFYDMVTHAQELIRIVRPGGVINYIVGNSKFYDVLVPVESIYACLFEAVGFERVDIQVIRKRTSKRELLEYLVSARKPV